MNEIDIISPIVKTPFILIGVLLSIFGILEQSANYIKWSTHWSDIIRGTKTEVSGKYINSQKSIGVICILLGSVLIIGAFTIPQILAKL